MADLTVSLDSAFVNSDNADAFGADAANTQANSRLAHEFNRRLQDASQQIAAEAQQTTPPTAQKEALPPDLEWHSRSRTTSEWLADNLPGGSSHYWGRVLYDLKGPARFEKGAIEDPAQGISQGIAHAGAWALSLGGYAPNALSRSLEATASRVDRNMQKEERRYQVDRSNAGYGGEPDVMRSFGNVASPFNYATAEIMAPAKGASFLTQLGRSMATGGVIAGEQPVYGDNYAGEKATQIATGVVTGAGAQALESGVTAAGQAASSVAQTLNKYELKYNPTTFGVGGGNISIVKKAGESTATSAAELAKAQGLPTGDRLPPYHYWSSRTTIDTKTGEQTTELFLQRTDATKVDLHRYNVKNGKFELIPETRILPKGSYDRSRVGPFKPVDLDDIRTLNVNGTQAKQIKSEKDGTIKFQ